MTDTPEPVKAPMICSNCQERLHLGEQVALDAKGWRHASKCGAELAGFKARSAADLATALRDIESATRWFDSAGGAVSRDDLVGMLGEVRKRLVKEGFA